MRYCALKANREGFAGKLPALPSLGITGVTQEFDFHVLVFRRWEGEVGSGGVAAPLALAALHGGEGFCLTL